jgi:hypothetical protein
MKNFGTHSFVFILVFGMTLSAATGALASSSSTTTPSNHKADRKVVLACAKANKITLPASNSQEKLSTLDLANLHACVKQYRTSLHACAENAGISNPKELTTSQVPAYRECEERAFSEIKDL